MGSWHPLAGRFDDHGRVAVVHPAAKLYTGVRLEKQIGGAILVEISDDQPDRRRCVAEGVGLPFQPAIALIVEQHRFAIDSEAGNVRPAIAIQIDCEGLL